MKYPQQQSNEWVEPVQEGFKLQCCGCGLIHTVDFRVIEGVVQYRMAVDMRATAQARRKRKEKGKE